MMTQLQYQNQLTQQSGKGDYFFVWCRFFNFQYRWLRRLKQAMCKELKHLSFYASPPSRLWDLDFQVSRNGQGPVQ